MKRTLSILGAGFVLLGCGESPAAPPAQGDFLPAFAATTATSNLLIPFNIVVFIPCALGGAGENADLTGALHLLTHITIDNTGGVHVKQHAQPQGLGGTGLTSGDRYRGVGVTQETFSFAADGLPFETTFINNFRLIGQGPGNNFQVHQTIHTTINANGDVTAGIDNTSVTCS